MSLMDKLDSVLDFVKSQTNADRINLIEFKQLSGGAIQDNYGLKVDLVGGYMPGKQAFVIRSDAPSSLAVSLSRPQEYQVIELAHANGVKAPKPYWLCTDLNVIGQEFYVMQWVAGTASAQSLVPDKALDQQQRKDLCFTLGREIALLHKIPYAKDTLPFLKKPYGNAAQQRIDEYQQALDRLPEPEPIIELGLQILKEYMPETRPRVLCHCDYRTGNYMVKDGQLSAILDWEFTAWSDPYEDLGWFCARSWRFGNDTNEAGGIGNKADFFAGYASISQEQPDEFLVKYWELMASVRWAIIALEQAQRFIASHEESIELALTGRMAPEIQLDLMLHIFDVIGHTVDFKKYLQQAQIDESLLPDINFYNNFYDQPHGANLLSVARKSLFKDILPSLPKDLNYNARMIASAMSMIERELNTGLQINNQIYSLLNGFYKNTLTKSDHHLQQLADDIRANKTAVQDRQAVFDLLIQILLLKLKITNPKRLIKIENATN